MPSNMIRGPLQYMNTTVFTGAGNFTITNETSLVVRKGTGAATGVTLPTVAGAKDNGRVVIVKDGKGDAAANNITITDPSAQTIDGAANLVLNANFAKATLQYFWDGTTGRWAVLG